MEKKLVQIDSFNPYESRFPKRKLVTRETLILIKYLRSEGYEIQILPDDNRKLEILYKKGLREFFADPINVALLGIPIGIITNIISNQIQDLIDRLGKEDIINKYNVNIQINNSVKNYNYLGEELPKNHKKIISNKRKRLKDGFEKSWGIKAVNEDFPTPIFLEHAPKIVGWCSLYTDEKGLKAEGFLTDKIIKKRIRQKRLNGMSVTGIAKKTECSICAKSYVDCNHVAGDFYEGKECHNTIIETDFVEASVVKDPINSECLISIT